MEASIDAAIADLAARQHGAVGRFQLRDLLIDPRAIQRRVRSGRLLQVTRDVFVIAGTVDTWQQRLMVALLDVGPGAVATRRAAAALWELPGFPRRAPEVLVKRSGDHIGRLAALSETSLLPPHHVTTRASIPVVTLPRLCFELAATEHRGRVERAVDNAQLLGMSIDALAEVVGTIGKRGRPGTTVTREIVEQRGDGYVHPRASWRPWASRCSDAAVCRSRCGSCTWAASSGSGASTPPTPRRS